MFTPKQILPPKKKIGIMNPNKILYYSKSLNNAYTKKASTQI